MYIRFFIGCVSASIDTCAIITVDDTMVECALMRSAMFRPLNLSICKRWRVSRRWWTLVWHSWLLHVGFVDSRQGALQLSVRRGVCA